VSPSPQKWFTYRQGVTCPDLRLFCFPFGGGGASTFSDWSAFLPTGIEVLPVQLPGRENRLIEPPVTSMPRLIAELIEAFSSYLDLPFVFFGHSMGALIAFELARELRRVHLPSPRWIFISGHPAPHMPRRRPYISHLTPTEFTRALCEYFNFDPSLLESQDIMDFILPALRADYELVESYAYVDDYPFQLPFSVFGGSKDPETTEEELLAWKRHTTGPFRIGIFSGDHFFIKTCRQAFLDQIAPDLSTLIESIRSGR
jgi:surfactin synthase thioesterase subunit